MAKDIEIKKISNPRKTLNQSERSSLSRAALDVARQAFCSQMGEEDVYNHVIEFPDILYLASSRGSLIGFSSYREFNAQQIGSILYLDGIAVLPDFQRLGLFKELNTRQIREGRYGYFAMRTQNPVIYGATKNLDFFLKPEMGLRLYPDRELEPPEDVKKVANHLARDELAMVDFDPQNFVGRRTYGKSLYGEKLNYPGASEFFEDVLKINPEQGDSVIMVGKLIRKDEEGW